jgi:hypothetical protein
MLGRKRSPECIGPFVAFLVLPHHPDEPCVWTHRAADGGECGHRISKEHHSEPADAEIEMVRRKGMRLGISAVKSHVPKARPHSAHRGSLDHFGGDVHAEHCPLSRQVRCIPAGLTRAATDVEHMAGDAELAPHHKSRSDPFSPLASTYLQLRQRQNAPEAALSAPWGEPRYV